MAHLEYSIRSLERDLQAQRDHIATTRLDEEWAWDRGDLAMVVEYALEIRQLELSAVVTAHALRRRRRKLADLKRELGLA